MADARGLPRHAMLRLTTLEVDAVRSCGSRLKRLLNHRELPSTDLTAPVPDEVDGRAQNQGPGEQVWVVVAPVGVDAAAVEFVLLGMLEALPSDNVTELVDRLLESRRDD